ncbi:MAG: tRNA (guanosine(37)-N1)-methyltransferase TrmD [Betaproteobacteria bacterium]|jgi:tRNA (Guanine37-N(1)-) methyltransferase (EC 2.1.1.31)|nr:tRNA (guanosine(37)-N1)-methyltransferase TrmD [Betaproteobacteria bacterium]
MAYHFGVVTLFPEMFAALTEYGVTRRAKDQGIWTLDTWSPRAYARDNYRTVDDRPYGGGPGMVMLAEPLTLALRQARQGLCERGVVAPSVVYLTPQGAALTHQRVLNWVALGGMVLLAGRYEGIDQRVIDTEVDEEVSLGDFVLSGGELPAMAVMDAIIRQLPGTLGNQQSVGQESFVQGLLEAPHYTRPEVFAGKEVPPVLMSGHHADIQRWRRMQSLGRTWQKRPDMLARQPLSGDDQKLLEEFRKALTGQESDR